MSNHVFRLGELFAGAGGMALGAHRARFNGHQFKHAWATDMNRDACDTLRFNLPVDQVSCSRVEELDFAQLPAVDGLAFGFPCNDFSIVGERNGLVGKFGRLYAWGVRGLKEFTPSFFVAENVSGLQSSGARRDFALILDELRSCGYALWPRLYRFEHYGVPQSRHRTIIVGFREELGISEFLHPEPTSTDSPPTCKEALENIPRDAPNKERTNHPPTVIERLRHIKPGENVFTAELPDHLKLKMKSGAMISQIYRRLDPVRPAYTVTGSGGGGTHLYHWKEDRSLTNRERARLQTFPDSFRFIGGKESVRKQIGMAVPPHGAQIIFEAVLKTLDEHGIAPRC